MIHNALVSSNLSITYPSLCMDGTAFPFQEINFINLEIRMAFGGYIRTLFKLSFVFSALC